MADEIVLGPDETVPGKPFADPEHTRRDEDALRHLLRHERARARLLAGETDVLVRETDPEGLRHLLVVPDTGALLAAPDPTVVGFFGRPRSDADEPLLFELEEELVAGMGAYAADGLLSYYDVELVKGAYGNLILFSTPDVPAEWYQDSVHRRAVEISPHHYYEVRLHKGSIRGRLTDDGDIVIERTKYFDFAGAAPWQAVRRFSAG